jgi:hypothetical protein
MRIATSGSRTIHAALCILLPLIPLGAQPLGVLSGRVADATGAALPNASLTIKLPTGEERQVATGPDGSFRVEGLQAGSYHLRAHSKGSRRSPATLLLLADRAWI